jgi:arsenate reductase (thioredoxin)
MTPYKILFICTGNSARSIIAEKLIQRISNGRFQVFSAGSKPTGKVHPAALRVLKETYRIDPADARSKSLDEFIQAGTIFDFVITLCDSAKEACPIFPGQPITAHWSSPDRAAFEGDDAATFRYFVKVAMQIQRRIELFCSLSFDNLDRLRLQQMTAEIGEKEKLQETTSQMKPTKPNVLILCTGNSCRSHLAEGILRQAAGDLMEVHSAGSNPAGYVHPKAIAVLKEIGIDISAHTSKHMNEFLNRDVTTVITVCGNADQACPMFPGQVNRHHWGFDDPAHATGTEEQIMDCFRRVRDQIKLVFEAYAAGFREGQQLHS